MEWVMRYGGYYVSDAGWTIERTEKSEYTTDGRWLLTDRSEVVPNPVGRYHTLAAAKQAAIDNTI